MSTTADLVARTYRNLFTGSREELNTLAGGYTAGGNALGLNFPSAGLKAGASLAIDLELFYVYSVDSSGIATVAGAQGGSLPADHDPNAQVTINPKFSAFDIFNALNNDLNDLNTWGLYRIVTVDIVYHPPVTGYDITGSTNMYDILDIRWKPIGPSKSWPRLTNFAVMRGQDTTIFPSGNVISLYQVPYPGRQMRVRFSAPFEPLVDLTTDVADTGLPPTAYDLPPLGAAVELTAGLEVKRNFSDVQGSTRHATEIPPGANLNSSTGLMRRRMQRIVAERQRLTKQNPLVSTAV
jgi:hypothetical protein